MIAYLICAYISCILFNKLIDFFYEVSQWKNLEHVLTASMVIAITIVLNANINAQKDKSE